MDISINPHIKTAIIYSLDDLYAYHIEITGNGKRYYLTNRGKPICYGNMKDVLEAVIKENVQEAYLALSKTYEEVDATTCHANHDHYDYIRITLQGHLK